MSNFRAMLLVKSESGAGTCACPSKHVSAWNLPINKNNLPLATGPQIGTMRLNDGRAVLGLPIGLLKGTIVRKVGTKDQRAQAVAIRRLADKFEGKLKRAYLKAIAALKRDFDIEALSDHIKAGKIEAALADIQAALNDHGFKALTAEFNDAVIAGGKQAASAGHEQLYGVDGKSVAIDFVFDVAAPKTSAFLREYGANKITGLLTEQRKIVRDTLEQGFSAGRNPISVARDIRGNIGLTDRQSQAVANFRNILELGPEGDSGYSYSDYSSRQLRDARYDSSVATAFEDGEPLAQGKIDAMVSRYQESMLDFRADNIGRTEGIGAVSAGNMQVWEQAVSDAKIDVNEVRRYWVYTDDEKVRDAHVAIPEMNPNGVGLDEPFDSPLGDIMFPGDPSADPANSINCRCVVIYQVEPKGDQS